MRVRSGETPRSPVAKPPCVVERPGAKRGRATDQSATSSEACSVVTPVRARTDEEEPSPSPMGEGHGRHQRTWSGSTSLGGRRELLDDWHNRKVPHDRDVQAFHDRAETYEDGWRGRMHHDIAARTADLALSSGDAPRRVLDVGCGTGYLLRLLATRIPEAEKLFGIDATVGMVAAAKSMANDPRLSFSEGVAEKLPFPDESFDLVVSSTSFDHWEDQGAGLGECARVLASSGHLVLTDLFSPLLLPTLLVARRDRARTKHRAEALLKSAGFRTVTRHGLYSLIIGTVVASK